MTIHLPAVPSFPQVAPLRLPTRTARWVSDVASPPLLAVVAAGLAASALETPEAWAWAGLHVLLAAALPTAYIAWLVQTGKVTDMHLRVREQRLLPMTFCAVTSALSVLLLGLGNAPSLLLTLAVAQLLQAVAFLGFTQRWKVSAHCAAAAGLSVLATFLRGQGCASLGAGVLLVAWSRLHLGRHTLLQTVGGTVLGLGLWGVVLAAAGF